MERRARRAKANRKVVAIPKIKARIRETGDTPMSQIQKGALEPKVWLVMTWL